MIIYHRLVISFNLVRHSILYKTSECFGIYSITCNPCWNTSLFHWAVNALLKCGEGIFKVAD